MVYVCTTNTFSLITSFVFNNDKVKKILKIPILSENEKREMRQTKVNFNFVKDLRKGLKDQQIIRQIQEREELREKQFAKAGTKVPQQTFKTRPTKINKGKEN